MQIILPTCYNIMVYHEIWRFFGRSGYPTDMRNTNRSFDLWQIQSSDYPADMRKFNANKDLWLMRIFLTPARACARPDLLTVEPQNPFQRAPFG
jgi:hypothetical protein